MCIPKYEGVVSHTHIMHLFHVHSKLILAPVRRAAMLTLIHHPPVQFLRVPVQVRMRFKAKPTNSARVRPLVRVRFHMLRKHLLRAER